MATRIDPNTGEITETLTDDGLEIPDPNPMEIPAGMKRPETLAEQVQRLVRTSISAHAAMKGHETFEEAEDFDIEDDFDPSTPYELEFDPVLGRELTPAMFQDPEHRARLREEYLAAERNIIRAEERQAAIDEAYKAAKKPPKKGVQGDPPALSSDPPA